MERLLLLWQNTPNIITIEAMKKQEKQDPWQFETTAVHAGMHIDPSTGAIITPIYQTSTFALAKAGESQAYEYARVDNPTRTALQEALAALEAGQFALSFSSGLAAIDTLLRLIKPGEHVIAGDDLYGGTYRLFSQVLAGQGVAFSFVDTADHHAVQKAITPATRLIYLETPSNPTLKLSDIKQLAQLAHDHDAWLAVDNTFATPALQRPLALGADFALHSTTKYISGHSDTIGGAIVCDDPAAYEQLKFLQKSTGAIPGPMDCFLTLRGIRTLALRIKAHSHNGLKVAQFLADHPAVAQVIYPGLESHPQHALARKQMLAPAVWLVSCCTEVKRPRTISSPAPGSSPMPSPLAASSP